MRAFGRALFRFSEHPATRITIGLALLLCGIDDLLEGIAGDEGALGLDLYHGVIMLSLQHVAHGLGDLLDGVKNSALRR